MEGIQTCSDARLFARLAYWHWEQPSPGKLFCLNLAREPDWLNSHIPIIRFTRTRASFSDHPTCQVLRGCAYSVAGKLCAFQPGLAISLVVQIPNVQKSSVSSGRNLASRFPSRSIQRGTNLFF